MGTAFDAPSQATSFLQLKLPHLLSAPALLQEAPAELLPPEAFPGEQTGQRLRDTSQNHRCSSAPLPPSCQVSEQKTDPLCSRCLSASQTSLRLRGGLRSAPRHQRDAAHKLSALHAFDVPVTDRRRHVRSTSCLDGNCLIQLSAVCRSFHQKPGLPG